MSRGLRNGSPANLWGLAAPAPSSLIRRQKSGNMLICSGGVTERPKVLAC